MENRIACLMADGFEELELVAFTDILRRAGVKTDLISLENITTKGAHGIEIKGDSLLKETDFSSYSGIYLPGGRTGAENLINSSEVIDLLKTFDEEDKLIAAICAAPLVLKEAGILSGAIFTSYPSLKDEFNGLDYIDNAMSVQSGNILTSIGPSTASFFAFDVLHYMGLKDEAEKIWEDMLFPLLGSKEDK